MNNELTALLALATKYSRARSRKTKLVAKLAAGRIKARLLPERTRREVKKKKNRKDIKQIKPCIAIQPDSLAVEYINLYFAKRRLVLRPCLTAKLLKTAYEADK